MVVPVSAATIVSVVVGTVSVVAAPRSSAFGGVVTCL